MNDGLETLIRYSGPDAVGFSPSGLVLTLHIGDPELCAELEEYQDGGERHEFALGALKIGILALRHAKGRIDAERVREEGDRLLEQLGAALAEHERGLVQQLTAGLKEYFDPQSGRFNERIERLIRRDGELEQALRRQVGADGSELVRALTNHIGEHSPLMQMLNPQSSNGLLASIGTVMMQSLNRQQDAIFREFSLDNKEGALARLVAEVTEQNAQATCSLAERVQQVVAEFSLDRDDSALSRLVRRVDQAQKQISSEFSLEEQNSALARMRRELLDVIKAFQQANDQFQKEVLQRLAETAARKEESRRSTRHGLDFEDAVLAEIEEACQAAGDIATHVGNTVGRIKNCKKGDIVVELGCEHAAAGARIVIEAKEEASFSLKSALKEIEEARKNHDAAIGLVVLSARTAPPGIGSLTRHGNDIVIVWDPENRATDISLKAGLSVGKAISTRAAARRATAAADFEAIESAIRNIEKRTQDLDQISTWATTIKNNGENIVKRAGSMKIELTRQIETLDGKVRDVRALSASSV